MIAGSLAAFAAPTAAAPGQDFSLPVSFDVPADAPDPNTTLRLVNEQRSVEGLSSLTADRNLGKIAAARAADIAGRQYYAHKNPDGKYYYDYFKEYGIETGFNCENLDMVFVPSEEQVIDEWSASIKGHRGCMMDGRVTRAGYAAAKVNLVQFDGSLTTAYVIVAIHAQMN